MKIQEARYKIQTKNNIQIRNSKQIIKNKKFDLEGRTTRYGKSVIRLCMKLPKGPINNRIIDQVIGASGSIGANYREANDALGKKDFIQRLKISRRETKESQHWLELLKEANLDASQEIDVLLNEASELKNILSSIILKSE